MVAILDSSGQLACGGSLVDEWVVLVLREFFFIFTRSLNYNGLEDIFPDASNNIIIRYYYTIIQS